jgi:hypothetical protein
MDVPLVPDDAARQLDHSGRAQQPTAGRVAMIAATPDRDIQSERNRVGKRQLDLAVITARPQDAKVRNHAMPRTDDRDCLSRRVEAVLVKWFFGRQLVPWTEQSFEVLRSHMAVARRDIDHEPRLTVDTSMSVRV